MEYAFNVFNRYAADGTAMSVRQFLQRFQTAEFPKTTGAGTSLSQKSPKFPSDGFPKLSAPPVVLCIGSDLAIGDSLGPVTGSMLKRKTHGLNVFIYGTLSAPVTAKEIKYVRQFLKETHPSAPIIAIDAAVGSEGDIGLIKILDTPLKPGAGANKNLGEVGDLSILGIVAEKSVSNYAIFHQTRFHLIYKMSEIISDALSNFFYQTHNSYINQTPNF
jgi:putative sporulation protein YyaC